MKRIFLVRHGESRAQTGEEEGIDTGLTARGREQSARLGKSLKKIPFDEIRTSPLRRARETLESSGISCKNVFFDSRLVELMPSGGYDGLLRPYTDVHNAWDSPAEDRLERLLGDILKSSSSNILLISHGMALDVLLGIFLGISPGRKIKCCCLMNNTAVSLLGYDEDSGERKLIAWNSVPEGIYEKI